MSFVTEKRLGAVMASRQGKAILLSVCLLLSALFIHHLQSSQEDYFSAPVLKLLGYWQEKNNIWAIAQNEDGHIQSLLTGMTLGHAVIKSITKEAVLVEYPNHQTFVLTY